MPDLQFDIKPFAPLDPASGTPALDIATDPVPAATASESLDDLAFDMNFGTPDDASAAAPVTDDDAFAIDLSKSGPNTDIDMAQLAREFELPPLPAAPDAQPASDLKDPLFDLDAMDFGLADTTQPAPAAERPEPVFDFGSTDLELEPAPLEPVQPVQAEADAAKDPLFDLDMMDFGQPAAPSMPATAAAPAAPADVMDDPFGLGNLPAPAPMPMPTPGTPAPRFDMSGLDLDLPGHDLDLTAQPAAQSEQGGAVELTAAQMEMETKLDLAIAYQEIGDKEGARELLDEVIKGGNVEQSSRASAMRAQLA